MALIPRRHLPLPSKQSRTTTRNERKIFNENATVKFLNFCAFIARFLEYSFEISRRPLGYNKSLGERENVRSCGFLVKNFETRTDSSARWIPQPTSSTSTCINIR